nr:DUF4190 domain-containing protein [Kribbella sandramycini]
MAIAAIACGLGGLATMISAPFGVGFGIAALVQLRKRPAETGKGLAITGIVSGGLITLGYGLLFTLIAVFSSGVDDDPYSAPLPGTSTSGTYVDELAVGECYDDGDEDGEVTRRDCARPHDGEVISNVTLPDGPYPGDAEVDRLGKVRCGEEFATYVGKTADKSELDLAWWTPTKRLWERDHDRLVVCSAYGAASGDRLTGSVKGTKR